MHQVQRAGGAPAQRGALTSARRYTWLAASALAWGAAQAANRVVASGVEPGAIQTVVPHVLALAPRRNPGVAFGLLAHLPPAATIVLALTVLAVVLYNRSAWSVTAAGHWGLGLMTGGALANITDRLRFGYVVDYLDVYVWPVFNLADTAIVIGAGLLLLALRAGAPRGHAGRAADDGRPACSTARSRQGGEI